MRRCFVGLVPTSRRARTTLLPTSDSQPGALLGRLAGWRRARLAGLPRRSRTGALTPASAIGLCQPGAGPVAQHAGVGTGQHRADRGLAIPIHFP